MKINKTILITIALTATIFSYCQDRKSTDSTRSTPFQISFLYPMSTNGYDSKDIKVNYSFNIIGGYVGEVDGVEFGGLFNAVNGEMKGFQAAGFTNIVKDNMQGVQLAGYTNISLANMNGIQGSGFANVVKGNFEGIQLAGFTNIVTDTLIGVQAAGFSNYAYKTEKHFIQAAGFSNLVFDTCKGIQVAGFTNVVARDFEGSQIAGFGNICNGKIKGVQASGFINIAKKIQGTQIGFINIADSVDGVSIGFLSIVKNGYNHIEIEGNEIFYTNLNVKIGTEKFYNIISIGAKPIKNNLIWGFGYGAGTAINFTNKTSINIDASVYHVNDNEWFTDQVNLLTKLSPSINYKIKKHFTIYAGPSINALIQNDKITSQNIMPWNGYSWKENKTNIFIYPGLRCGMRF